MKRRRTIERWLSEVWPTKETIRRADEKDRKIDKAIGQQKRRAQSKMPETDWRRLMRERKDE